MYKLFTPILALLISSAAYAQNTLSYQTNSLRQDSVEKEVINFIEPGCSGQDVLWDSFDKPALRTICNQHQRQWYYI